MSSDAGLSHGVGGITMNKLTRSKKLAFVTLATLAIVLAVNAPSQAREMAGHGFGGGHPGGPGVHQSFGGHQGFNGHRGFDRGGHGRFRFGFAPVYPYYGYYPPIYGYEAPAYWYY